MALKIKNPFCFQVQSDCNWNNKLRYVFLEYVDNFNSLKHSQVDFTCLVYILKKLNLAGIVMCQNRVLKC